MQPARSLGLLILGALALLAGCSTLPPLPEHWLGVADLHGRVVLQGGVLDSTRVSIAWENVDRRQPDRITESGHVTQVAGDGRFMIPELTYGLYQLTVTYAGGTPRTLRVTVAEPEPHVDIDIPAGRVVVLLADDQLEPERVLLRPFAATGRGLQLTGNAAADRS